MEHQGKVVFVAGGTSGINLGIAQRFVAEGARVAVLSRSADKVDAARELLGEGTLGFAADVRDPDAVAAALAATAGELGPIDVLVSGAAGNFLAGAAEMSSNAFGTVVDIDLKGTFNVLRHAHPHLRKPGASIINITAPQSWMPTPFQSHVCAAKAGIDQLTRTLAAEWGPQGIRVNAIAPGPIEETEGYDRLAPTPAAKAAWVEATPVRRAGTLADIAEAASWLASDRTSYITGVVLPVDGGLSLGGSGILLQASLS